MNTTKDFVNKLKAWRVERDISQAEAARLLDISRPYLNQIEMGNREAGPNVVNSFEKLTAVSSHDVGASSREKLGLALKKRKMSPSALARRIGYDAGVINNVVNGTGRASEAMIERIIAELPELSKEDLLSGSDAPYILNEEGAHGTYGAKPKVTLPPGMSGRMVPILSMAQAGGWDAGHSDEGWTGEATFALNVDDRQAFAIRVSGNSMEPDIHEGDIVICSPKVELTQGCCAVVRTRSEQAFVKYWRKRGDDVILESANTDYKPIQLPVAEIAGAWPVIQRISSGMIRKKV